MLSTAYRRPIKNLLFALFAICSSYFTGNAFAADPIAILTDVKGSVAIERGKQILKGASGTALLAGDVVRVRSGKATVYYVTQAPRALKAGQAATVGKAASNAKSASTWRNVYAGVKSGFARNRPGRAGTMRPDEPMLISPVETTITTDRPLFAWTKDKVASDYIVVLYDQDGEEIRRVITPNTTLLYDGEPLLKPGIDYSWTIIPRDKNVKGELEDATSRRPPSATFTIALSTTAQAIQQERADILQALSDAPEETRRDALAAMLIHNGLYSEAITTIVPEILEVEFLTAYNPNTAFKNILPRLNESSRKLLHNALVSARQKQWASFIHTPEPEPDKTGTDTSTMPPAGES